MGVDFSRVRPGDQVTIRATVQALTTSDLIVTLGSDKQRVVVPLPLIDTHTPKALVVGDSVQRKDLTLAEIIGIDGTFAWLELPNGAHATDPLTDLVVAPTGNKP